MFTDRGFSHALARIILEKDPTNETALKMLQQPKNRAVVNGVTYNLDKVSEDSVDEIWAEDVASRLMPLDPEKGQKTGCAWDNISSPDFDGCNGCEFACALGKFPPH